MPAAPDADSNAELSETTGAERRWWRLGFWMTLLVATATRTVNLSGPGLWADEASSLKIALHPLHEILAGSGDLTPPLYYALLHLWVTQFGTSVVAMRSLSVVLGVAAVALVGWAARRLIGPRGALLAMALLAVSPMAVFYAQMARSYSLFLVVSIASFGLLMRWEERRRPSDALLWLGATAAMAYTHNYWVFNIAAQQLYMLAGILRRRVRLGAWLAMTAAAALLFAPWVPKLLQRTAVYSQRTSARVAPDLGELFHGVQEWVVWKHLAPSVGFDLAGLLALPFFALALFGLVQLIGGRLSAQTLQRTLDSRPVLLLGLWVAVPVLTPWAWSQVGARIFAPAYLIASTAAYVILIAHGVRGLPSRWARRGALIFIVAVAVANTGVMATREPKQDWPGVAALLVADAGPNDVVIVSSLYHEIVLAYYREGPQAVAGRVGSVPGWRVESRLAQGIDRALGQHVKLWVIAMYPQHLDLTVELVQARAPCAALAHTQSFMGFQVIAYDFSGCL